MIEAIFLLQVAEICDGGGGSASLIILPSHGDKRCTMSIVAFPTRRNLNPLSALVLLWVLIKITRTVTTSTGDDHDLCIDLASGAVSIS